jgi:hypothetical protein
MTSAISSSIRTTHEINGDENKNQRIDGKFDKIESKTTGSRPLAPIDSNQLRQTPATSAIKASSNTKLQSQSHSLSTDDPNSIVTIEEVRKAQDGSITIHRYLRGKLLGKVGQC